MNFIYKIYKYLLMATVLITAACQDDIDFRLPSTVPAEVEAGIPTTITVNIDVDSPVVRSRSGDDSNITSLWVGVYSAIAPYERTGQVFISNFSDDVKDEHTPVTPGSGNINNLREVHIDCETGPSYIVAVANFVGVKGIVIASSSPNTWDTALTGDKGKNNRMMSYWLAGDPDKFDEEGHFNTIYFDDNNERGADYLAKFFAISGMRASIGDASLTSNLADISIDEPTNGHIMSGNYHFTDEVGKIDHSIDRIDVVNIIKVNNEGKIVPENSNSAADAKDGAVHLRRLLTENTFNITTEGDVVDMDIIDIEVFNLPKYGWLYARQVDDLYLPKLAYPNAGDAIILDEPLSDEEKALNHPYYHSSLRYTPPSNVTETTVNGKKQFQFVFWQAENKRTGIIKTEDYAGKTADEIYALREEEWKKSADGDKVTNSGIYKSLSKEGGDMNNNATYVKIQANITYKDNKVTNPDGLGDTNIANPSEVTTRTAQATYIVHLGYAKDASGNADPNDFNCYRNSKYTYNVKIASVNKILVEAFKDNEARPGAEGTVTDVTDKLFELDAHNGVFNIYLTKEELRSFSFVMRSYYSGVAHTITYDNTDPGNSNVPTSTTSDDWKFYDWVEIVPTGVTSTDKSNETKIATYPGYGKKYHPKSNPKGVLYLKDLVDNAENLDGQWFTVYVNEYTYEIRDPQNSNYGNETVGVYGIDWKKYVGQPNRNAWFNVSMSQSSDLESEYFKAKYALTQKSIQSIYNLTEDNSGTGFGLEHDNESFGMNLRWVNVSTNLDNFSADNGRYNVWHAMENGKNFNWSNYLSLSSLQTVNAITNSTQTKLAGINTEAKVYNVPMQRTVTPKTNSNFYYDKKANSSSRDPQISGNSIQYVELMYACLNRNRDENGNGTIDKEELKWYVPSSGKYVQAILGRSSLPSPLMDFSQSELPGSCGEDNNTIYHYATSDGKKMWLDEGMSSSYFVGGNADYNHAPWQVRCVRNFGADYRNEITKDVPIDNAYDDSQIDQNESSSSYLGGVVVPKHYYGSALRAPAVNPILPHKVSSRQNNISYYGFEIAPLGNIFDVSGNRTDLFKEEDRKEMGFPMNAEPSSEEYEVYVKYITNATPCANLNDTSGRTGWRLPNQRETVIMLRSGAIKGGGNYGRYVTCTQEHWANFGGSISASSLDGNHRLATVEAVSNIASCNWSVGYVRCVRDLTEDEYGMTYEEVKKHKTGE